MSSSPVAAECATHASPVYVLTAVRWPAWMSAKALAVPFAWSQERRTARVATFTNVSVCVCKPWLGRDEPKPSAAWCGHVLGWPVQLSNVQPCASAPRSCASRRSLRWWMKGSTWLATAVGERRGGREEDHRGNGGEGGAGTAGAAAGFAAQQQQSRSEISMVPLFLPRGAEKELAKLRHAHDEGLTTLLKPLEALTKEERVAINADGVAAAIAKAWEANQQTLANVLPNSPPATLELPSSSNSSSDNASCVDAEYRL